MRNLKFVLTFPALFKADLQKKKRKKEKEKALQASKHFFFHFIVTHPPSYG